MSEIANHRSLRLLRGHDPTDLCGPDVVRSSIQQERYSIPHTVGTCAMGNDPATGAAVDPEGHVHGVDRLAMVDSSVIPLPPSAFPHLVTIMLAERLSSTNSDAL